MPEIVMSALAILAPDTSQPSFFYLAPSPHSWRSFTQAGYAMWLQPGCAASKAASLCTVLALLCSAACVGFVLQLRHDLQVQRFRLCPQHLSIGWCKAPGIL